jgi:hypothetical protein
MWNYNREREAIVYGISSLDFELPYQSFENYISTYPNCQGYMSFKFGKSDTCHGIRLHIIPVEEGKKLKSYYQIELLEFNERFGTERRRYYFNEDLKDDGTLLSFEKAVDMVHKVKEYQEREETKWTI